jgi:hypothetical protein
MVTMSAEAYHGKALRTSRIPFVLLHGSRNQSIIEEGFNNKAIVQITSVKIAIDHLLDIGPSEAVLPGEMLVIEPDKDSLLISRTPAGSSGP